MEKALLIGCAFVLDLFLGDPPRWPHPVVMIGRVIAAGEKIARRLVHSPLALRLAGALLVLVVVSGTWLTVKAVLNLAAFFSPLLARLLEVYLLYTALATRCLAEAAYAVQEPLCHGNLAAARDALSGIVSRDTAAMPREDIIRATIETVAENTSDGVIAPLFFAFLGGAPLALAYKAVNTLDSMLGYKNERYLYLGWAAARLDDVVNYIPARLTALFLILAAFWTNRNAAAAWRVVRREARNHPSPNSGYPEAAVAGALGVRLGGWNVYHGRSEFRPYMGEMCGCWQTCQIAAAVDLMYEASIFFLLAGIVCRLVISYFPITL